MSEQKPSDELRAQIFNQMSQKETDVLVAIWRDNDREGWTDEAFEAVEAILLERLGELPGLEEEGEQTEEVEFPTDKKLFRIADLSGTLSWAVLGVAMVYSPISLIRSFAFSPFPEELSISGILTASLYILDSLDNLLYAGFVFLFLQAIEEIIYLLMDIREIARLEPKDQ